MKLKLDEQGHVVVQDGKPVYVSDDGKEVAFDAPGTVATISRLNGEAKSHRERAEAAEGKLKPFEAITDPGAALKALETVANLDAKKLVDAGEIEKVKGEISKAFETRLSESDNRAKTLEQQLHAEKIGGSFSRSKFITEKAAIPADLVQARFGSAFSLEDGKVVAKDANGNKLYSRANPGELAGFDEALELLVEQYPYRDQILKGSGASGSGAGQGGGNGGGSKTINRKAFDALDPSARIEHMKGGGVVTD
ncbi:DUF6651 domain-containing protein [Dyella kyungheensis]|uniref:DUF6651 domain-containing protein n=1 Tax=Dyella kyungheensis TaxID=1242174 RepID=UPI003CEAFF87